MWCLVRSGFHSVKNTFLTSAIRPFSITTPLKLKEIRENIENSTLVVEGLIVQSPRAELLVRPTNTSGTSTETTKAPCYMCSLGLDVKHTDVLILSQFVRSDGCMLPRRITGLCSRQQRKIGKMVSMAQKAGLMINLTPQNCNKDPTKRREHKKFNTYFDEKTIFWKRIPRQNDKFKR